MPAHIVESSYLAVLAAHGEHRTTCYLVAVETTGLLEILHSADTIPAAGEDRLTFQREDLRLEIKAAWKVVGYLDRLQNGFQLGAAKQRLTHVFHGAHSGMNSRLGQRPGAATESALSGPFLLTVAMAAPS